MTPDNQLKPKQISSLDDLVNFYWLKSELIKTCKIHGLAAYGAKLELINRICIFFKTGDKVLPRKNLNSAQRDGVNRIEKDTLVRNYRNDASTRDFFVRYLGDSFKFNAYLRQFKGSDNVLSGLTYGDLLAGYLSFECKKTSSDDIPKQFEYNQFIKDYFHHEAKGTLKKAVEAWKLITSIDGPNTYQQFLTIMRK